MLVHVTTTDMSLALLLGPQLRAFAAAGYEVVAVSAPGPHVAEIESWGIRHVALPSATRGWAPLRDVAAAVELWRVVRSVRPLILHTHNPKPGVYGRVVGGLAGVPVVVNTVHGLYAQRSDDLSRRIFVYGAERTAARWSHAELVQNGEDLEKLARLGVPRSKLQWLGNGVELERFRAGTARPDDVRRFRGQAGVEAGDLLCAVVGRLVWEKGLGDVVAAARELAGHRPRVRFAVVGPADPDKADALGDDERAAIEATGGVRFLGWRADVETVYAAADLVVVASHREGFSRVAMEAAAMGRPVVATDIRGCRETVEHGVNGLLVPVHDPNALARAIAELASDPDRRAAMGAAGREKAERDFDVRRVIDVTLDVYRRLAGPVGAAVEPSAPVVRRGRRSDAAAAAALHAAAISEGFLARLGERFLRRLYRRIASSPDSFLVVAARDGDVVGFAAGTEDARSLFRRFVLRDGVVAAIESAPRLLRSRRQVLETLRYPGGDDDQRPRAELLAVAVASDHRGQGIARSLVGAVTDELMARGATPVRVVVGDTNAAGVGLYEACGFRKVASIEVHEGVASQVLAWG